MRHFQTILFIVLAACCAIAQQAPANKPTSLSLKLVDASPSIAENTSIPEDFNSIYFDTRSNKDGDKTQNGMFRNIYPGIDVAYFSNNNSGGNTNCNPITNKYLCGQFKRWATTATDIDVTKQCVYGLCGFQMWQ